MPGVAETPDQRRGLTRSPANAQLNYPEGLPVFSMESPVMSDHQLRFKGPGFDFDAKGWMGILAAIVIVGIIAWLWH
jgi:hypothetical protein